MVNHDNQVSKSDQNGLYLPDRPLIKKRVHEGSHRSYTGATRSCGLRIPQWEPLEPLGVTRQPDKALEYEPTPITVELRNYAQVSVEWMTRVLLINSKSICCNQMIWIGPAGAMQVATGNPTP